MGPRRARPLPDASGPSQPGRLVQEHPLQPEALAQVAGQGADPEGLGGVVTRQEEVEEKTAPVVDADRLFMDSMVEVNAPMARISAREDGQVPAEGSVPTDGSKTGQEAAGTIAEMSDNVSFHAPGGCSLELGDGGIYGFHSVVHGGPTNFPRNDGNFTVTGRFLRLGDESVLYRSRVGDNVTIGYKSVVEQSDLPSGTVIGDRVVIIGNVQVGRVEW